MQAETSQQGASEKTRVVTVKEAPVSKTITANTLEKSKSTKPKISQADFKEYNKLTKEIEKLEREIKALEEKYGAPESAAAGYSALAAIAKDIDNLKGKLALKEEKWMEITDKYEV